MSDAGGESLAALTGNAVFDLQHLGLIAVDGTDAEAFLQGQLSNDVREVGAAHAQLSAWCSPKGRVLAAFLVFRHEGRLLLQLPQSLLGTTLARLRLFVLRTRVSLEDASASLPRLGLVGAAAEARLAERIGPLPGAVGESRCVGHATVIRLHGRRPRYEIVASPDVLISLKEDLGRVAVSAGADAWQLLDIEAGVADIAPATSDSFVPQMINLDRIGALSFTKGCYVGQEIVARTQHLGRIKRRMYLAHRDGSSPVAAGDTLHSSADPASPRAQVVNAQAHPGGGYAVLAVIPIHVAQEIADAGLALDDGSRLTLRALPYAFEDEMA